MISSLIEQAKNVLTKLNPGDDELLEAETGLSNYLEALATNRIGDRVEIDDLEEANRLLREIRRERSRRGMTTTTQPAQNLESEPSAETLENAQAEIRQASDQELPALGAENAQPLPRFDEAPQISPSASDEGVNQTPRQHRF